MIESITDCAFSCPISVHPSPTSVSKLVEEMVERGGKGEGEPTLIVVHDVTDMISSRIVCFAHAHGVVREVDVAVVACSTPEFALVDCFECKR